MVENTTERSLAIQNSASNTSSGEDSVEKIKATTEVQKIKAFSSVAQKVAAGYSQYKLRAQEIEKELKEISLNNKHNLEVMDRAYERQTPLIDQIIKGLDEQLSVLNTYKDRQLSESEHKTFQFLIVAITKQIDSVTHLYDLIMG